VRDEKGENRSAQRKVDQISGKPVRRLLDGRTRMFRPLDGLNDLAEGGFFSKALREDLKGAGLIDGTGINCAASRLFTGHRLACNGRLLHEGVTVDDLAIDGNPAAGANEDNFSRQNRIGGHFKSLTVSDHAGGLRKKIQMS
jgi:hypothetical protein